MTFVRKKFELFAPGINSVGASLHYLLLSAFLWEKNFGVPRRRGEGVKEEGGREREPLIRRLLAHHGFPNIFGKKRHALVVVVIFLPLSPFIFSWETEG